LSSPLPPLCRSPFESELPSPGSLWCPVVALAPAVAPDLPLLPPLAGALLPDELVFEFAFATSLSCVELSLDELWLVLAFELAPVLAFELAPVLAFELAPVLAFELAPVLAFELVPELAFELAPELVFELALEVAAALLEELLDELELIDWPPPVRVWSLPEPACVVGLLSCVELVLAPLAPLLLPSWPSPSPPPEPPISWSW